MSWSSLSTGSCGSHCGKERGCRKKVILTYIVQVCMNVFVSPASVREYRIHACMQLLFAYVRVRRVLCAFAGMVQRAYVRNAYILFANNPTVH